MKIQKTNNYRWVVCVLLFFATTINYIDRQSIGLLKPTLEKEFNWTELDYSDIVITFSACYALGYLFFGNINDRIGYTISVTIWSIAAVSHSVVKNAAVKAVAEWFPKSERGVATGIFNSGTSIGALVAPLLATFLLGTFGWQEAFWITVGLGFI
jgi:ACS family hexuronate transporter-like MFS transporter